MARAGERHGLTTPDDIVAIGQVLALYGHAADGDPARLDEVFTADAVFDGRATGGRLRRGLDEIRAFFTDEPDHHPPAHHTTNCFVYEEDGTVRALSKWLAVDPASGGLRCGDYRDELVRTEDGWRVRTRVVVCRWWAGRPPARAA